MTLPNTTNFATNLRWLANIPMNILFPDESDVSLNLTTFDIPNINIQTVENKYQGYTVESPAGLIDSEAKEITFEYIIDSDMRTYFLLYKWANLYTQYILDTTTENDRYSKKDPQSARVPVFVSILDEYKNVILKIKYYNCWIKSFTNLSLSYQDTPSPLTHSFTFAYERFEIERIVPEGYHMMPDGSIMQGAPHDTGANTSWDQSNLSAPFSASNTGLQRGSDTSPTTPAGGSSSY